MNNLSWDDIEDEIQSLYNMLNQLINTLQYGPDARIGAIREYRLALYGLGYRTDIIPYYLQRLEWLIEGLHRIAGNYWNMFGDDENFNSMIITYEQRYYVYQNYKSKIDHLFL